jgi:3-dehydroquinate synthase
MTEIKILMSKTLIPDNISEKLIEIVSKFNSDKIFILVDENSEKYCYPIISDVFSNTPQIIKIKSGEKEKNIDTAIDIWNFLSMNKCDRNSLLINLGGGVITDIGGFVASTFKRGINFINIPTTLLSQIDAAIGGKTGINLNNIKNEIGFFNFPEYTIIDPVFLKTLEKRQIISGFGEMLKHTLISNEQAWENLRGFNLKDIDLRFIKILIEESLLIKKQFIENDPNETGYRKALNFGHTFGHAIETFYINNNINILHGEAIAMGLICELFLSNKVKHLELKKMLDVIGFIIDNFPYFEINPKDYNQIYDLMLHDKKNVGNKIKFALISDIGKPEINQTCTDDDIFQSLGFYFQIMR